MSDSFRNNESAVQSVVGQLQSISGNYRSCVEEIDALLSSIASSPAWIDENVKTSFLDSCNSYLLTYYVLADAMDLYVEYINSASGIASEIESHYAG